MALGNSVIAIGSIPPSTFSSSSSRSWFSKENPASGTGIITKVTVNLTSAELVRFYIVNAATMTVRSISGTISASSGNATYSVSLDVVAGDFIGVAGASGDIAPWRLNSGGAGGIYAGTSLPTVGSSVSGYALVAGNPTWRLHLAGSSS